MMKTERKLALLKRIAHSFNQAGITWALGASMMLYFKGIARDFHDLDLMIVNEDASIAQRILSEMGVLQPSVPNPKYKSKMFLEFVIDGIDVDLIAGFAIVSGATIHDCSLRREQIVEKVSFEGEVIPLQSPALWREYYLLMGRNEKAALIDRASPRT